MSAVTTDVAATEMFIVFAFLFDDFILFRKFLVWLIMTAVLSFLLTILHCVFCSFQLHDVTHILMTHAVDEDLVKQFLKQVNVILLD